MAKIFTIGLDELAASQLGHALGADLHEIHHKPETTIIGELIDADIVFANAEGKSYLPLLREMRAAYPELPFVVVTRVPEPSDWLDALEAGATDYCSAPFEPRYINWLMETALTTARTVAA